MKKKEEQLSVIDFSVNVTSAYYLRGAIFKKKKILIKFSPSNANFNNVFPLLFNIQFLANDLSYFTGKPVIGF